MIEVSIAEALGDFTLGKNMTFKEGGLYFMRVSKCGLKLVVRGDEGYWQPLHPQYRWSFSVDGFKTVKRVYTRDRRRLNEFSSAEEFLVTVELKKYWYNAYHDHESWKR